MKYKRIKDINLFQYVMFINKINYLIQYYKYISHYLANFKTFI